MCGGESMNRAVGEAPLHERSAGDRRGTGTGRARVLLVGRGLGLGGMEQLLLAQVRGGNTERFSYSVAYANPDKDALVADFESLDIPVHCLSSRRLPWPVSVRSLLAREHFDIVHVHSPLVASVVRLAATTMRDRPLLVYTEHNSWDPYGIPTRWANRLTYRFDDSQFAVSRAAWESVPEGLRSKLEVLSHGIDVASVSRNREHRQRSRRELGIGPDEVVVGTVANFRPEKNYEGLLRVAERVVAVDPSVRFVSIGQGPLQSEIERLHAGTDLGDRFLILGAQPEAPRLMAAFDAFVLASHVEGLPVAFMEARALGLPVVVTAVGGLPDHVRDGTDGLLVAPGSDDELVAALERLTGSAELRHRLASGSAASASEVDASHAITVVEQAYSDLLEAR